MKCLEKDLGRRYPSALALALDLERWQKGIPVEARKISTAGKIQRWIIRHPLPSTAIGLALFSLIVGTFVSLGQWQRAEKERDIAEELAYFSNIANALSARENFDFREARKLLAASPPARREIEWHLINHLCHGDQQWSSELPDSPPVNLALCKDTPVLLLHDGSLHQIQTETGNLTPFGKLPQLTIPSPDPVRLPGLRELTFSPDGRHYAWLDNRRVAIAESHNHSLVYQTGAPPDASLAWLDNKRLIYAIGSKYNVGGNGLGASIYDLNAETTDQPLIKDLGGPIVLSPDGTMVALVQNSRTAVIYQTTYPFPKNPLFQRQRNSGLINKIAFSSDSKNLAISWQSENSRVEVHRIEDQTRLLKQNWPTRPEFSFLGKEHLILTGREPWFSSWNFTLQKTPPYHFKNANSTSAPYRTDGPFRPPSQFFTRRTQEERTRFFFGHDSPVTSSLPLPNGTLLTVSLDGSLRNWSMEHSLSNLRTGVKSSHTFYHPHASHNGDYVIYQNQKKRTEAWHRHTGETFQFPEHHAHLAILNDGHALTRSRETAVTHCWLLKSGESPQELWQTILKHDITGGKLVNHCSLSPDERYLGVQRGGRLIGLDLKTQKGTVALEQNNTIGTTPGQTCAISPDGNFIVTTGFQGNSARIYEFRDVSSGHRYIIPKEKNTSRDSTCAFSPDGTRLYVGNNNGLLKVYQMPGGQELTKEGWQVHSSEVTALAVSQNGRFLATSGDNGMIIWSIKTQQKRLRIRTGNRNWIQYTGNDSLLYHCGSDSPIEVLKIK